MSSTPDEATELSVCSAIASGELYNKLPRTPTRPNADARAVLRSLSKETDDAFIECGFGDAITPPVA
jgi:hypothetical protein